MNSIHFLSILNIPFGHNKQTQSSVFGASFPTHWSHSLQTTPCYIIFLVAVRLLSPCHHQRVLTTQNTQHTACSEVVNDIFIHSPKLWGESSSKQCQNKIFHIFFSRFSLCLLVRSRIWISKRHERWREKKSGWMSKRDEKISRYLQKCVIDTIRHRAVQECFNSSDILYLWLQILVGLFSHTYTCSERWHVKTRGERSVKEMINLFSMGYDHTSQLGRLCEEDNKFLHKKVRENFSISTFLTTPPICS